MDDTRERIANIIEGVDLQKKARATKKEKEAFESLKDEVGGLKNKIDKLNLRLWHACSKGDCRSLPFADAKEQLRQARDKIDRMLNNDT